MEASHHAVHVRSSTSVQSMSPMSATPNSHTHTHTHAEMVRMRERFTAPFMVYDAQTRRIVANSQYDRTLVTELHRLQGILLTKLRTPIESHPSYTPKELLYELEAALYHVCASLAVQKDSAVLRHLLTDSEADPFMPQLEFFLAHHNAPAKAVVALAHCLSEGTSNELLTSFLCMLEERIQQELDPVVHRKRSEKERAALRATENNLRDMAQLVRDVQTAYHSIDTASQRQRRQPQSDPSEVDMARTPAANAISAKIVEEAFYKVLRWVVAVDADRRALLAAATATASLTPDESALATAQAPAVAATPPEATPRAFAKVIDYDAFTGQLKLERADAAQRWGLLVNAQGLLVGLENEVRNSSEAAERLYNAVQQQSGEAGGLAIYEVNRRRIRSVHLSDGGVPANGDDIMQKLRSSLTQNTKTLHLLIEKRKQADLTVPREVLFEVSYQGGEGGVGQRCILMMERASTSISWGLKVKYVEGAAAVLSDFAPRMHLSNAAKNLLFDMRGRLRVQKINNRDMTNLSMAEMRRLITGSLLLTLHLQVTDAKGNIQLEAVAPRPPQEERPSSAVTVAQRPEVPAEDTAVSAALREAVTSTEADVAGDEQVRSRGKVDSEQAKLNDVATLIADEFLKQQNQEEELEAEAFDAVDAPEVEEADAPALDTFEEYDWSKPTTTIGAPGDEHGADDTRETVEVAATGPAGEDFTGRTLLECFQSVIDGKHFSNKEKAEELTGDHEGNTGAQGPAADADAAKPDTRHGIEAADGDAEVEPPKKTRGRKRTSAKGEDTPAKKSKKNLRGGRRKRKGADFAEEGDNEDEPGRGVVEEETYEGVVGDRDAAEVSVGDAAPKEDPEELLSKDSADNAAIEDAEVVTEQAKEMQAKKKRVVISTPSAAAAAAAAPAAPAVVVVVVTGEKQENVAGAEEGTGDKKGEAAIKVTASVPVDVPLVDLPPTAAEVAIELGSHGAKKRKGDSARASATEAGEEESRESSGRSDGAEEAEEAATHKKASLSAVNDVDDVPRVSLSELLKAEPLTFENDVRLEMFDGSTLELERSSAKNPWNVRVAFAGDDIIMTKLPPFSANQLRHPFLRTLRASPKGEVKWVVEGLNGQDLSVMTRSSKTKALETIKSATKLSFVLRALRR
ncbi:hypothetical protein JKF63_03832 [Porcisia hertigi]|uniref:Uncharacterized protein n=1 Tax=Porcisia hertigi TaxID=2761500 RepID=A0A836IC49_9TRYP|nr:hypothetical protein JKF63_03832 [Porcisia hertigi]